MKQKTKLIVFVSAFCFLLATCLLSVFAVKNFDIKSGGTIEFVAPGIDATISNATLSGISKKTGSGQMQTFSITRTMTESQISDLDEVKSWSGIKLLFDDESEGVATISFSITNNSDKATENIMVNLSSNTTNESPIQATPSGDFCIGPGASHTFTINLSVANLQSSAILSDFKLTVDMKIIKPSEVISVADYSTNGMTFTTTSSTKTATFSKYTQPTAAASTLSSSVTDVEIPAVVKDGNNKLYTVTSVGSTAFSNSAITSIKFPSTLKTIEMYAFESCVSLSGDLVIPDSVTEIKYGAFSQCKGLTGTLTLSKNLTTFGLAAFESCGFVGDLVIPDSITDITGTVFVGCTGFNGRLVLPKRLKSIGVSAFYGCTGFTGELKLPETLENLGGSAFKNCSGFSGDLVIPDSVTGVGAECFENCTGFKGKLVLGDGIQSLANRSFSSSYSKLEIGKNLTNVGSFFDYFTFNEIYVREGNPTYCSKGNCLVEKQTNKIIKGATNECLTENDGIKIIGKNAFYRLSLAKINIPYGVETIEKNAYDGCKVTGGLVIPDTVITIGNYAFYNCYNLNGNLVLGENIETIGNFAFASNWSLSGDLTIPNSVKTIGDDAFRGCSGFLGVLTLGDSIESLGLRAFWGCSGLKGALTIPSKIKEIKSSTFQGCSSLSSINLGQVEIVQDGAFWGCTGATSLILPNTITYIGANAFASMTRASGSFYFTDKLTEIGENAFGTWSNNDISFTFDLATPPVLGASVFSNVSNLKIYVPSESLTTYKTAENWSTYADKIFAIS